MFVEKVRDFVGAVSISGWGSPGQWACEAFSHGLGWGSVAKDESGAPVELMCDLTKVSCSVDGQVGALGKVLPQQAVGVLVRAALPG